MKTVRPVITQMGFLTNEGNRIGLQVRKREVNKDGKDGVGIESYKKKYRNKEEFIG